MSRPSSTAARILVLVLAFVFATLLIPGAVAHADGNPGGGNGGEPDPGGIHYPHPIPLWVGILTLFVVGLAG